jgi:hypothetical protein
MIPGGGERQARRPRRVYGPARRHIRTVAGWMPAFAGMTMWLCAGFYRAAPRTTGVIVTGPSRPESSGGHFEASNSPFALRFSARLAGKLTL